MSTGRSRTSFSRTIIRIPPSNPSGCGSEFAPPRSTITTSSAAAVCPGWQRSDIEAMLDYAASGELEPVIDRVMPLSEVHEAERLMEDREVFGKIVLEP